MSEKRKHLAAAVMAVLTLRRQHHEESTRALQGLSSAAGELDPDDPALPDMFAVSDALRASGRALEVAERRVTDAMLNASQTSPVPRHEG